MSLTQSFGGAEAPCEADTITALEFDESGEYLATGDHGGRVVIFRVDPAYRAYLGGKQREASGDLRRKTAAVFAQYAANPDLPNTACGCPSSSDFKPWTSGSHQDYKTERGRSRSGMGEAYAVGDDAEAEFASDMGSGIDDRATRAETKHSESDAVFKRRYDIDYGGTSRYRTKERHSKSSKDDFFEDEDESAKSPFVDSTPDTTAPPGIIWTPFHQFQSHESEFDFLKSLEIAAKVSQLKFLTQRQGGGSIGGGGGGGGAPTTNAMLLSSNDKTIKLWKLSEKHSYVCSNVRTVSSSSYDSKQGDEKTSTSAEAAAGSGADKYSALRLPRRQMHSPDGGGALNATLKTCFTNAHSYHINTLTVCPDGESFASVDDLRVNLWHFRDNRQCFNVIDCKPSNMEDLSEVITSAAFHPTDSSSLAFSTSKGCVKLVDFRKAAVCHTFTTFTDPSLHADDGGGNSASDFKSESSSNGMFNELMRSISDLKFSSDGRFMATRDYLNVKIWDLKMTSKPLRTIPVHNHLRPLLPQLYESDSIFDKFALGYSPSGRKVVTGSYNNRFIVRDIVSGKALVEGVIPNYIDAAKHGSHGSGSGKGRISHVAPNDPLDYSALGDGVDVRTDQRVVHCAWHPFGGMLAIAGVAGLHMYRL